MEKNRLSFLIVLQSTELATGQLFNAQ